MKYLTQNVRYTTQNLFGTKRYHRDIIKEGFDRRPDTKNLPGYSIAEKPTNVDQHTRESQRQEVFTQTEKRQARKEGIDKLEQFVQNNAQYLTEKQMMGLRKSIAEFRAKIDLEATDQQQASSLKSLETAKKKIEEFIALQKQKGELRFADQLDQKNLHKEIYQSPTSAAKNESAAQQAQQAERAEQIDGKTNWSTKIYKRTTSAANPKQSFFGKVARKIGSFFGRKK